LSCDKSDTRRAALRPAMKAPVLVLLAYASLPNRDAFACCPTSKAFAVEHSEDQRARVEGPSEGRVPWRMQRSLVPASGAYALWRMPTTFPSSATSGHPLSSARLPAAEEPLLAKTDRPRSSFRRHPAKGAVFQKTRMPFTAMSRRNRYREGMIPSGLRAQLSRSRRPHFFPRLGTVL